MADESDFFDTPAENLASASADNDYRHFRLIYESEHGFCRIFTARRHGRSYVVKTLREPYLNVPLAQAALRKEFDCGMLVDSPYVARTYDFITLPDLGEAIVMEYCPGSTLAQLIADGTLLSTTETDKIVISLAHGIEDIHSAGLIHRDLKPENIIWMPQSGALKIIDLGFSDSESFYLLHNVAGTMRYTPPEKANVPDDGDPTPNTYNDFYALGVILTDLIPIASIRQQKILKCLSEMLIAKDIASGAELEARYNALSNRVSSTRYLPIIIGAAALVLTGLAIFLIRDNHTDNNQMIGQQTEATIQTPFAHTQEAEGLDAATASPQVNNSGQENQLTSGNAERQAAEPTPEIANQKVSADNQQRVFVHPTELIKDEYGVCMAEAKYKANFSRDEIDEYTVNLTDKLITESIVTLQNDEASPETRQEAYRRLTDYSIIEQRVAETTLRKYPSANRHRILGLSSQRLKFRLSEIDLTHLKP